MPYVFPLDLDPYPPGDDYHQIGWFEQQDPLNGWQADTHNWLDEDPPQRLSVHEIDWGDNLEAKNWTEHSIVRVETVLFEDKPMNGYFMEWLRGLGIDEMWGTNGVVIPIEKPTIYSPRVHLTIQKLLPDAETLLWDPDVYEWTGDVGDYGFTQIYGAEVNVKGKIIYGYNWNVRKAGDGIGVYRITTSFDPSSKIWLNPAETVIIAGAEEEVVTAESDDGGDTGGGTGVIDFDNNLTYIDVTIVEATGGGGGGGGDGGNGPGEGGGGAGGKFVAAFSADPTTGTVPLTVQFTDDSAASATTWWWNFGDGEYSGEQNPSHTYASAGMYTVSLTVQDDHRIDDILKTGYISVGEPGLTVTANNRQQGKAQSKTGNQKEKPLVAALRQAEVLPVGSATEVSVDIKPMSCPNPLNVESLGILPVAILGTADFDVESIDVATVVLLVTTDEPTVSLLPIAAHVCDVSQPTEVCDGVPPEPDGYMDLLLQFDTPEVVAAIAADIGAVEEGDELLLVVTGQLTDGSAIAGADSVVIMSPAE